MKVSHVSTADHDIVNTAVAAAQAHSSGEIVTVIAATSNDYDDVALVRARFIASPAISWAFGMPACMFIIVGILLFFPLLIFPACFGANQRHFAKKKAPFPSDAAGKGAMFRIFSLTARSGAGSSRAR